MDPEIRAQLLEALNDDMDAYTYQGGNEWINGTVVTEHDVVEEAVLVELDNGFQFAITVDLV